MTSAREIEGMALIALAGMDHRAALRSPDPVLVQVEQAIAERTLRLRREIARARDQNLAVMIANNVAKILRG